MQFGAGRVSATHVPLLQYLPAPQVGSSEHVVGPVPPSPGWVGFGWQTSFLQVKPSSHLPASQGSRHAPSAHTLPDAHSLENLQAFCGAVQVPLTHTFGLTQAGPVPQPAGFVLPSGFVEPSGFVPVPPSSPIVVPPPPGSKQSPLWQVSPLGHCTVEVHVLVHPAVVQTPPPVHCALLVQLGWAGPRTFEQPYASHE